MSIPDNITNIKKYLELISSNYDNIILNESNKDKEIDDLKNKIIELEKKITDLNDKIKSKSSSSIWESMQLQLQEKDKVIEQLKKDINFYSRQNVINSVPVTNSDKKISQQEITTNNKQTINNQTEVNDLLDSKNTNDIIEKKEKKVKKDKKEKKSKKKIEQEIEDIDDLEKDLLG